MVTTQNVYNTLKKKDSVTDKLGKFRKRSTSREISSILTRKNTLLESDDVKSPKKAIENEYGSDPKEETQAKADGDEKVQQVIHQNIQNSETSLRHLFYLEYKKSFNEGQHNPIVFSKFGKKFYGSDEKFDPNNF